MTKIIAIIALLTLMFLAGLGNWWYTFGIWPKSWVSFFGFFVLSSVLTGLLSATLKAED